MKVTLMVATSADGFIARESDEFVDWTGAADKDFFTQFTTAVGTVIMGMNTYRTLKGPLPGRLNVVLSSSADAAEGRSGELEFYSGDPKALLDKLSERGIQEVVLIGGSQANASFLLEGLVDDMYVTIVPKLFGQGLCLSSDFDLDISLELIDTRELSDGAIILHYNLKKE